MKKILNYLDNKEINYKLSDFKEYFEIEFTINNIELGMMVYKDHKLKDFINEANFAYHHCAYSNREQYDKIEEMIDDESKVPDFPFKL